MQLKGFDAAQTGDEAWWNEWYEDDARVCPACNGTRLNPAALAVRFRGRSIAELTQQSVADAGRFIASLELTGSSADGAGWDSSGTELVVPDAASTTASAAAEAGAAAHGSR